MVLLLELLRGLNEITCVEPLAQVCPVGGWCNVVCLCPSLAHAHSLFSSSLYNLLRHRGESHVAHVPSLAGLRFSP